MAPQITIARNAIEENQAIEGWPNGTTIKAASTGPSTCRNAAELKHRLRKSITTPDASRAIRADSDGTRPSQVDQRRRDQDDGILMRDAEQQQSEEGEPHAGREREGCAFLSVKCRPAAAAATRKLERQRDHADLRIVEA